MNFENEHKTVFQRPSKKNRRRKAAYVRDANVADDDTHRRCCLWRRLVVDVDDLAALQARDRRFDGMTLCVAPTNRFRVVLIRFTRWQSMLLSVTVAPFAYVSAAGKYNNRCKNDTEEKSVIIDSVLQRKQQQTYWDLLQASQRVDGNVANGAASNRDQRLHGPIIDH